MTAKHNPPEEMRFKVDDYVTTRHVPGVVFQVYEILKEPKNYPTTALYRIRPVFGAFGADEGRGYRQVYSSDLELVDLVRAGIEHLKMQEFIRKLSTWRP